MPAAIIAIIIAAMRDYNGSHSDHSKQTITTYIGKLSTNFKAAAIPTSDSTGYTGIIYNGKIYTI